MQLQSPRFGQVEMGRTLHLVQYMKVIGKDLRLEQRFAQIH